MDVIVNIEKKFERDVRRLSALDQEAISRKINQLIHFFKEGKNTSSYLYKLHNLTIGLSFDSSLYVLKINRDVRVILTSEEDPLFNEHILTLLRVVRHNDLDKTFRSLAESFNQSFLSKRGEQNG